jgi:hypothetical protein
MKAHEAIRVLMRMDPNAEVDLSFGPISPDRSHMANDDPDYVADRLDRYRRVPSNPKHSDFRDY